MRTLAILLLALLTTACAAALPVEPRVQVEAGEPFALRVGQEAVLGDHALQVRVESVLEDSRCPAGAVCVWQGNARLRLRLSGPSAASRMVDLNTGVEPRSAATLGYRVELLALDPVPGEQGPPAPGDYTARLRVTREI